MAENEEQLLRQFQEAPSPDALRGLLLAHQDRIYNACFQVLGRAEDAEDAAQEALLKLAEGARSARDADAFRGWIYRVSLHTALDHWRRREATRNRELRSAMNRPATPPLEDRERVALFEAMDGLDDRERALLLEHYFEKVPLAELGDRRGISAVAIWKRIDKAREKLKRALLGAGFVAASARIGEALEASVPATAPSTLVGEFIVGKILAGGLAVGASKSSMLAAGVAVLLVGLFLGGRALFSGGEDAKPSLDRPRDFATKSHAPAPAAGTSTTPAAPPAGSEGKVEDLKETLQRYKAWVAQWKAGHAVDTSTGAGDHRREARKEFKGIRALILKDPEAFLEFLRDPANEEVSDTLIGDLLFQIDEREGRQNIVRHPYGEFPASLMEGLAGHLKSGPPAQKKDILLFLVSVDGLPDELNQAVADVLDHSDGEVRYWAVCVLSTPGRPLGPRIESRLMERCLFSREVDEKSFAIHAISKSEDPETRAWMLSQLERNKDPQLLAALADGAVTMGLKAGESATLERAATLLTSALKSDLQEEHAERVLASALRLPVAHATRILQAVQYKGLAPRLTVAISVVLDRVGRGDCTPKDLQTAFTASLQSK